MWPFASGALSEQPLGVCRIQAASNPYAGKSQPIGETRTRYSRKFRVNRAKGDVCCPHLTAKRDQSDRLLAAASYSTSSNRAPSVSAGFSLLLHVYPLSQVPQFIGAFIISPLPPLLPKSLQTAGPLPSTGVTRLPWYYQPLRHPLACQPTSRCFPVIRPAFAPPISRRGEEGFSSCLARPRHRTVATTPPECRSASASLRCVILLSSSEGGLSLPGFDVSGPPLRSLALRPGDSPTTPYGDVSMGFKESVSFLSAVQATGFWLFPRRGPATRRPPLTVVVSMGFRSSVSLLPAIQTTGLWLLPRRAYPPLNAPAFAGRT